jgi:flagellar basal body-associated protein FliL
LLDNTKKSSKKLLLSIGIVVLVLAIALLVLSYIYTGHTIRKGIKIGNTDVSWMTPQEAKIAVNNDLMSQYPGDSLTFVKGNKQCFLWLQVS